jgi:hypothetical protein
VEENLILKIPLNSVIVQDNASYHSGLQEDVFSCTAHVPYTSVVFLELGIWHSLFSFTHPGVDVCDVSHTFRSCMLTIIADI